MNRNIDQEPRRDIYKEVSDENFRLWREIYYGPMQRHRDRVKASELVTGREIGEIMTNYLRTVKDEIPRGVLEFGSYHASHTLNVDNFELHPRHDRNFRYGNETISGIWFTGYQSLLNEIKNLLGEVRSRGWYRKV